MLQFLNDIPVYLFDREQAAFTGLNGSGNVDCRVTRAAILRRANLTDAGPAELLTALMRDRVYFEDLARDIHARNGGAFVLIDARDLDDRSCAA